MSEFREKLFLLVFTHTVDHAVGSTTEDRARISAIRCNIMAEECCKQWGHDLAPLFLDSPGANTIASPYRDHGHKKCGRCGAVDPAVQP